MDAMSAPPKIAKSRAADKPIEHVGGGSLLIAWQLKGKRVLIVGGGLVAGQRVESVLSTDAHITVMCPPDGLKERTRHLVELYPERVTHVGREFAGTEDLEGVAMVLTAIDDPLRSMEIVGLCRGINIPVNAADIPELCDFYFGAQIRDGPLQIMISTNGNGPRMAAIIKRKLQAALTGCEGDAISKIGMLRALLRERMPAGGTAGSAKRMGWMTELCNKWELEEFTLLDEDMAKRLLDEGFEKGRVPTLSEVAGVQPPFFRGWENAVDSTSFKMGLSTAVGILIGVLGTIAIVGHRQQR